MIEWKNNTMSNWLLLSTNIIAFILMIIIFSGVCYFQKWHTITVADLTISGALIAMAVLLNGFTTNIKITGFINLRLGDVVIFYMGYRCSYLLGCTSAVIGDLIKSILFSSGAFHLGFTFNACLLSFIGALSKQFSKEKPYFLIGAFIVNYLLVSFVFDIIWLTSLGYIPLNNVSLSAAYLSRGFELLWALPLYLSFVLLLYKIDKLL